MIPFISFGQNFGGGVQFGGVTTNIYTVSNGVDNNFEADNGVHFGFNAQAKFGNIAICTELNYEQNKFSKTGDSYFDGSTPSSYPQIMNYTHYHLSLPFLIKVYFGPFNLQTGVQISRFTSGFEQSENGPPFQYLEEMYYDYTFWTTPPYNSVYWRFQDDHYAGIVGFGLDLNLGALDLFMSCRTIVYTTPIVNMDLINAINAEYNSPYTNEMIDEFSRYVTINIAAGFRINIF